MEPKLKIYRTTIPGDMTMEEWQSGGFSRYNHPKSECKDLALEFARSHVENFERLLQESNITAKKYLELHLK